MLDMKFHQPGVVTRRPTTEASRIAAVRRLAEKAGMRVAKSKARNPGDPDYGKWSIGSPYNLTLDALEAAVTRMAALKAQGPK